jgi:hypothetical protein
MAPTALPKPPTIAPSQPAEFQALGSTQSAMHTKPKSKKKSKNTRVKADFLTADLEWYQSKGKETVEVNVTDSSAFPNDHPVQEASASTTQPITSMDVDQSVIIASSSRKSPNLAPVSVQNAVTSSEAHSVPRGDSLQEAIRVTKELLSDMPEVDHESVAGDPQQASTSIPMQSSREGPNLPITSLEAMQGVVSDMNIPCGVSTDVSHPRYRS